MVAYGEQQNLRQNISYVKVDPFGVSAELFLNNQKVTVGAYGGGGSLFRFKDDIEIVSRSFNFVLKL